MVHAVKSSTDCAHFHSYQLR
uniref:Uncharacterized protein n=1 Tax=Anguilla anguilla TaxID=7936 RepID=A0A0E9UF26_ANGAN